MRKYQSEEERNEARKLAQKNYYLRNQEVRKSKQREYNKRTYQRDKVKKYENLKKWLSNPENRKKFNKKILSYYHKNKVSNTLTNEPTGTV